MYNKSAYQQNLASVTQPVQPVTTPTQDVLKAMAWYEKNNRKADLDKLMTSYAQSKTDPTSKYYQPYSSPTNQAVRNLTALGFDMSVVDDNWFNVNSGLKSYLQYNGTTNTPSKPGKNASWQQQAAYEYYQLEKSEEKTKQVENQWKALQEELTYWTQRADRNYSDEQVINQIDWSKYGALEELRNSKTPVELNRGVDFSEDAIHGVIWAARNNGGTGNRLLDMGNAIAGYGNQWKESPEVTAKLNENDENTYDAYSVGMTSDKVGLYFGKNSFSPQSIEKIRKTLDFNDDTAKGMYQDLLKAEDNTEKAEAELKALNEKISKWVSNDKLTEERIMEKIEAAYNSSPTIKAMNDSLTTVDLVPTTRAISGYKLDDIKKAASARIMERDGGASVIGNVEAVGSILDGTNTSPAGTAANSSGTGNVELPGANINNKPIQTPEGGGNAPGVSGTAVGSPAGQKTGGAAIDSGLPSRNNVSTPAGTPGVNVNAAGQNNPAAIAKKPTKSIDQLSEEAAIRVLGQWAETIEQTGSEEEKIALKTVQSPLVETAIENIQKKYLSVDLGPVENKQLEGIKTELQGKVVGTYPSALKTQREYTAIQDELAKYQDELETTDALIEFYYQEGMEKGVTNADLQQMEAILSEEGIDVVRKRIQSNDPNQQKMGYQSLFDAMQRTGTGQEEDFNKAWTDQFQTQSNAGSMEAFLEKHPKLQMFADMLVNGMPEFSEERLTGNEEVSLNQLQENKDLLEDRIIDLEDQLEQGKSAYDEAMSTINGLKNEYKMYKDLYGDDFRDDILTAFEVWDAVSGDWSAYKFTSYTPWQEAVAGGTNPSSLRVSASSVVLNNTEMIEKLEALIDNFEGLGYRPTEEELKNAEQALAVMKQEKDQAARFLISTLPEFHTISENARTQSTDGLSDLTKANIAALNGKLEDAAANGDFLYQFGEGDTSFDSIGMANLCIEAMTDDEKDMYFYLLSEGGEDEANEYMKEIMNSVNGMVMHRVAENRQGEIREWAGENAGQAFASWVLGYGANALGNLKSWLTTKEYQMRGIKNYDPNGVRFSGSNTAESLRAGLSDYVVKNVGEENAEVINLVLNALNSAGDSTINSLLTSGAFAVLGNAVPVLQKLAGFMEAAQSGKYGALAKFGAKAAEDWTHAIPMALFASDKAYRDAISEGASEEQAKKMASATFWAESVSEAITVGNIKDMWEKGAQGEVKSFLKSLFSNGLEEAVGEGFNQWWESNAEKAIMGELSSYNKMVESLVESGVLRSEAEKIANQQMVKEIAIAAASGFISSGFSQTGAYVGGSAKVAMYDKAVDSMVKKDVNTLTAALSQGTQNSASFIASVLGNTHDRTDLIARDAAIAAGQHMAATVGNGTGKNGLETTRGIIAAAGRNAIAANDAITYGALTNGNTNRVLQEIATNVANGQAVTAEDVQNLVDAQQEDTTGENAQALQSVLNDTVYANRVARRANVIRTRNAQSIIAAETVRNKAEKTVYDAQDALKKAESTVQAKADSVVAAAMEMSKAPTDENKKIHKDALTDLNGAYTAKDQAADHLEKSQKLLDEAQAKLNQVRDQENTNVREQAVAEIQQEDEQRAAIAEQQAAQQQAVMEQQAAMQAEQDQKSGKAWEDNRDEIIEKILDEEYLEEGERREQRRNELMERADMIRAGKINMAGMMNNAEGLLATGILARQLGVGLQFTDDESILPNGAAGKYEKGVVYLNNKMIQEGKMTIGQAVMEVAMHEFTHYMEGTKNYSKYSQTVLDFLFQGDQNRLDAAIDSKKADYKAKFGQNQTDDEAQAEIVADFARTRLNDRDVIQRFMADGLAGKVRNALHNINQAIKNYRLTGTERETAEYLRKTERLYQKMIEQAARSSTHPDGGQFSIAQLAEATGLEFNENTLELRTPDGTLIDGVLNKMTPEMMTGTPVGMLIGLAENGMVNKKGKAVLSPTISKETAKAQKKMFADLANMAAQYRDSDLVWEIASSTLFSAMKSNSDPQYSTTVDFGTICAKTQEIINVMSRVMLEQGRGLTRDEVLTVYNETANAGLTVPCPVCYVFSRWMGVPSLLGQMSRFQKEFLKKNADGSINIQETKKAANEYIKSALEKYGDKDGINDAKTSITNKLITQEKNRLEALKVITSETATEEEKANAKVKHDNAIKTMDALTEDLGEIEAYNWVTQALCKQQRKGRQVFNVLDADGNYVIDSDFVETPDDVLFDLRRTGDFAKYAKNWSYRNTRGAGMGKAIMPYSGESIGDIIYGTNRKMASANPFLTQDPETAAKGIKDAIARAVQQNLIGGQRLQSTSDFRPEWGLDYLMTFLELQAIGSKVQMYTKVAEAVPLLASMGGDINLSIMGKGKGWHIDENGNYVLDFSDVTGMNYETAKDLKDQYSNVQMILVGMNDTHIRLALADTDIDFVIPWHASGNSKDTLASLVSSASIGQEQLETSSDYTDTQSDKASENQTADQKKLWDLRMKILQGKRINAKERETIYTDKYLKPLYVRFNVEGKDPDCYHVKLKQDQAKQIFPYEYWDKSLTKEQADENGRRFVDYCQHFGITPRFSGVVKNKDGKVLKNEDGSLNVTGNFAGAVYDEEGNITGYDPEQMYKGYWKVLIDRPMYDNDGNYRDQQVVDVTKAKVGHLENGKLVDSDMPLTTSAMYGPNYSEQEKNAVDKTNAVLYEQSDLRVRQRSGQFSDGGASLTQLDQEYDEAVRNDDMETAQAMVDEKVEEEFADSKARTSDGKLMKLYHGTKEDFNVFDPTISGGKNGTAEGYGIYMTDNPEISQQYGERQISAYADIKRPAYGTKKTIKRNELTKVIKAACEKEANAYVEEGSYSRMTDALPDTWISNYVYTPEYRTIDDAYRAVADSIIEQNDNDSDIVGELLIGQGIRDYSRAMEFYHDILTPITGIDGIWQKWENPENGKVSNVILAFDSSQIKDADPVTYDDNGDVIPLSQRFNPESNDIRYSDGGTSLTDLDQTLLDSGIITQEDLDAYNGVPSIPSGLPGMATGEEGTAQRQFGHKTAQESDALHQRVKDYLYTHSSYTPDSNQAQIDRAISWVQGYANADDPDGYHAAVMEVLNPDFDYRSADGQARMLTVLGMAALKGDTSAELQIADVYNRQGTDLGQQLQARKMFRLMTPLGRRTVLQQQVAKINQEYANTGKDTKVELSDSTLKAAELAQTEEDFEKVQKAAYKEIAEQTPASWKDRVRTWRMMAMLANPRTHIRNLVGNAIFVPTVGLKNAIGTGLEKAFVKEGGERTKAIRYTDDAKAFAKQDAQVMKDTLTGEAKYSQENKIQREQKAFGQGNSLLSRTVGRGIQNISDFNSDMLELEDWIFLNKHYQNALASYMTANGLTSADMTGETLERARTYAVLEAQKATYRDANATSDALNKISRKGGVGGFLVDAVLPFKKTPANILRRGLEYSPVGLIRSLASAKKSLDLQAAWEANGRKGNAPKGAKSLTQVLDDISAGLTGTGIAALGALGYALGAVKLSFGGDPDDELKKERGEQEYSIQLFGHSFTFDWAAPVCMPFFVGASLYKTAADQVESGTLDMGAFVDALSKISEPVFNLSMLDGVSNLLKSASYSKGNIPVVELLQKVGANYIGSFAPSALGAVARTVDTTRRKSYVESGASLNIWRLMFEQVENKIPYLSMNNIPYRDVWGNAETSSYLEAILENFLLPGYYSRVTDDELVDELQRIYDQTGESSAIPKEADKTVAKQKLNDKEYNQYVVDRGQMARSMLDDLISRPEFIALTPNEVSEGNPEAQASLIGKVWSYANAYGKKELFPESKFNENWMQAAYESGNPIDEMFKAEEEKARKAAAADYQNQLIGSIYNQDAEAMQVALEGMKKAGKTDTGIRQTLTSEFKKVYETACQTGDQETKENIEASLTLLDLGKSSYDSDDFAKWEKDAYKKQGD